MQWPFVSRRHHKAELDAVNADRERLRSERDQFAKDRDTQRAVAKTAARQFADADEKYTDVCIVNECLTHDLIRAREELAVQDADGWQARYEAERKRADGLQRRLDDAMGLNTSQVSDGRMWQHTRHDKKGVAL